jgi:hypothetical protein
MRIRQWICFFLEKTSPSPTLSVCIKTLRKAWKTCCSRISTEYTFKNNIFSRTFENFWSNVAQVDKICFRILWTWSFLANLPRLILQPSVASTKIFYNSPMEPLALFLQWWYLKKFSTIYTMWGIHFLEIIMQTFWWESLRGWDFCRPQLVVVSGLFGGNPFVDGIFLGHNLLLSHAFSVGIPWWMGFF